MQWLSPSQFCQDHRHIFLLNKSTGAHHHAHPHHPHQKYHHHCHREYRPLDLFSMSPVTAAMAGSCQDGIKSRRKVRPEDDVDDHGFTFRLMFYHLELTQARSGSC